jgi:hypothetical protein
MLDLPKKWLRDFRAGRQLRRMAADLLGVPRTTSRAELERLVKGTSRYCCTMADMEALPWVRRARDLSMFEVEVETLWWNVYLLPWRAQQLQQHLDHAMPAHVLPRVKPCLW